MFNYLSSNIKFIYKAIDFIGCEVMIHIIPLQYKEKKKY